MTYLKEIVKKSIVAGIFGILLTGFMLQVQAQGRQTPAQGQQLKSEDVSKEEIKDFIEAANKIRPLQTEARQEIEGAIQSSSMDVQRFQEISQAQRNPSANGDTEISQEEQSTFDSLSQESRKIQRETQAKMKKEVEATGMNWQKFQQISLALRQNPDLQDKVKEVQQEQMQEN